MNEPAWVSKAVVLAIHEEQLAEHGGLSGVRDEGALESALDRPKNLFYYGQADLIELAAAYGFALAKNHPFTDGNKRTSAVVTGIFLARNGIELVALEEKIVAMWLGLADGSADESIFVSWLRANTREKPS